MPLQRASLADQAADVLADRIAAGEWPVGSPLPGEHALAAELGVGRSTVREAVRALTSRGLVRARQGAGVFVTATTPTPDWDDLLVRTRVADVVEARVAIEVQAARLAAARRTPADLGALRAALVARREVERATGPGSDDGPYVDADLRFHAAVVEASHNPVLVELFAAFAPRVRTAMLELLALAGAGSPHHHDQDAHVAIVRAVEDREPDVAAAAASEHLHGVLDALAGPSSSAAPGGAGAADPEPIPEPDLDPDPEETR
ncbi:FadR/GntR family transcriptional regulator [Luteimicrobium sp. NPDC057192]|uniref:FadR/GntR family transcriptional regulator n=1 Tax=Luteimicrobium sp. NPDC057192 TaxID=3346042 RepID=UPI003631A6C6